MINRLVLGLALTVLLPACAGTYRFTQTTHNIAGAKPSTCTFELLSVPPTRHTFMELGVVELEYGPPTTEAAEFQDGVRKAVCDAGGDAVISEINGRGVYLRGTVIVYRE